MVVAVLLLAASPAGAQQERPGTVSWQERQVLLNESAEYWGDLWDRAQWHYDRIGMAGMEGANAGEFFGLRRQGCADAGFEWLKVKEDVPFCRCRGACASGRTAESSRPAPNAAPRERQAPPRADSRAADPPAPAAPSAERNGATFGPAVCSCAASRLAVGSVTSCTVVGHRLVPLWSATGSVQVSTDVQAAGVTVTGIGPPGTGTVTWRPGGQCAVIDVRPAIRMEGYELPEPARNAPQVSGGVPWWGPVAIIGGALAVLVVFAIGGDEPSEEPVIINPR